MLDLGEQDRDILSPCRVGRDVAVSLVLLRGFFELLSRYEYQQLAEDRLQLAHGLFLLVAIVFGRTLLSLSSKAGIQAMPF